MWKEKFLTLLQANKLPLFFAATGLLLIAAGFFSMVASENQSKGVIIEEAASTKYNGKEATIVVDVAGSVLKPGVYKLPATARIQEALIAAGGLGEDADRSYIAKNINLALKLSDGTKIYIPDKSQNYSGAGLININSASEGELDTLPGIGPVTAAKIITNRPYGSVEELLTKKIVGQKVFGQIKEKIGVY